MIRNIRPVGPGQFDSGRQPNQAHGGIPSMHCERACVSNQNGYVSLSPKQETSMNSIQGTVGVAGTGLGNVFVSPRHRGMVWRGARIIAARVTHYYARLIHT